MFHVEHGVSLVELTYRIEAGPKYPWTRRRQYALFVTRHEGPALFDFSSYHFSTAYSRTTLKRRVARMFPTAVPEGSRR